MHDVVVVGAGPVGSRYARSAASRGRDVLVLEAGTVGRPLACSGHVSRDIWSYLPPDASTDLLQNEIYGARFHLDGPERAAYPFYQETPISNVIDRVGLDRRLADVAEDAGADLRENHTVTDVEERDDCAVVTVRTPDGTETVRASVVAGADGPRSRVRDAVSLPEPDELLHGVLGFDPTVDAANFVDVHLTVPGFFAWRIPRGDAGVEYGLAVAPGDDASDRFEAFTSAYEATIDRRCSGAIPIGPPDRTVSDRVFLLGDAAGQTKPFTGGGILYGLQAADIAAETIDPDRPATLTEYERVWRDELLTEIRLGRWIRSGYSLPEPLQRLGLWTFSGEIGVHMDRPSSLFSMAQLRALLSRHS
ncbi:MAG: geranylgeranyl reductase family protein [Natronomonas sp.]